MRKFVFALVAVFACGSAASAAEPSLADLGLGGLEKVSDAAGQEVRGLAVQASGLSSLGAIFYDVTSGSKANVDLVNFSLGDDPAVLAAAGGSAQNFNQIGVGSTLTLTFPGATTAAISSFSAGGASQSMLRATGTPFLVPNPATIPN